ncbi:hypothetical protein H257_08057 [Aphanomyces astaci]|uniref:Uncharacterized protein n=1 Tax=Aphanomyces astaci TaxID=112090 RepID=W4GFX3_APHAT|nr:hypothetical protein H257_08057 [Aphanomyces astaci]ETV78550.1 hypothetical protein H257_08057 [Aphanomyces astaci]|eukprot:XP_009832131.1 hypothetical protein H257_08057 [Aphanomyces astaci]
MATMQTRRQYSRLRAAFFASGLLGRLGNGMHVVPRIHLQNPLKVVVEYVNRLSIAAPVLINCRSPAVWDVCSGLSGPPLSSELKALLQVVCDKGNHLSTLEEVARDCMASAYSLTDVHGHFPVVIVCDHLAGNDGVSNFVLHRQFRVPLPTLVEATPSSYFSS